MSWHMGDTRLNLVLRERDNSPGPFVQHAQTHRTQMDIPAVVVNPLHADNLVRHRFSDEQVAAGPLDHAVASHPSRFDAAPVKESLAAILDGRQVNVARKKLLEWVDWATRSQLRLFIKLAGTVRSHLEGILAYVATGLSNGRTEGLNGKIRTITRRSFGFHSATSLIALIFLCCSGITLQPVHR